MTMWKYEYDGTTDETIIYWGGDEQATVDGKITAWRNGYPLGEARTVIVNAIQKAGTPDRIKMLYDFNYGFTERDSDQS